MLNKKLVEFAKQQNKFIHFKQAIDFNIISWDDIIDFFNSQDVQKVQLIGPYGKLKLRPNEIQDTNFVISHINALHSFAITDAVTLNEKLSQLYKEFCLEYQKYNIDFHLYGSQFKHSYGFPAHNDLATNYIIQIEGRCEWTIYNQQATFEQAYNYEILPESSLTISYQSIVEPGDILYIPSGKYHKCTALEKRLSLSIPILQV
jgi:ribosomal protein L16 Arg81 hydroxylase